MGYTSLVANFYKKQNQKVQKTTESNDSLTKKSNKINDFFALLAKH